jgi:ribosome hibernation promoting factor
MRLELTARHTDITPALRRLVARKLAKLERLLKNSALSAQVVLTEEKHRHRADITLHARGEKFLHGVGDSGTWETSLAEATDKISQQAATVKGKWQEWKRRGRRQALAGGGAAVDLAAEAAAVAPLRPARSRVRMPRILHASRQRVKPMSLTDAARLVESNGDGVVVFRDTETAALSVLYRRTNGELTLVETDT